MGRRAEQPVGEVAERRERPGPRRAASSHVSQRRRGRSPPGAPTSLDAGPPAAGASGRRRTSGLRRPRPPEGVALVGLAGGSPGRARRGQLVDRGVDVAVVAPSVPPAVLGRSAAVAAARRRSPVATASRRRERRRRRRPRAHRRPSSAAARAGRGSTRRAATTRCRRSGAGRRRILGTGHAARRIVGSTQLARIVVEDARDEDRDRRRPGQLLGRADERPPELGRRRPLARFRAGRPARGPKPAGRGRPTPASAGRCAPTTWRPSTGRRTGTAPVTASTRISANE